MHLAAAIAVAIAFWGPAPCDIHYQRAALPAPVLGQTAMPRCLIRYSRRIRKQRTLCTIIVHETGHIHGHHHSRNPRNIMYYKPRTPRVCLRS
jgi:hypothetical protein